MILFFFLSFSLFYNKKIFLSVSQEQELVSDYYYSTYIINNVYY